MEYDLDVLYRMVKYAESLGASYAEARFHRYSYELVRADNGSLKDYSVTSRAGFGVRVLYNNRIGFSATNSTNTEDLMSAVQNAVAAAKASKKQVTLAERPYVKGKRTPNVRVDPFSVPPEEKIRIALETNRAGLGVEGIRSSITMLGIQRDFRSVVSSDAEVTWEVVLVGISHTSVAGEAGSMERLHDSRSMASGWEFIQNNDWEGFARDISMTAKKALKAPTPPPGRMRVVMDPDLVGLLLHEAFGHASEGDLVASGTSILKDKIGMRVASEIVTIVDDGLAMGGYPVPYDDEGNPKERTVIVEKGVLRGYLTDRTSAPLLGVGVTGNGRAQDFENAPIVRQTNIYMEPGGWSVEEQIREARNGLYLLGRGAGGGQVDTGAGTFTFSAGPSYFIRNGEIGEMVKGVVISGYILETLKSVEAVGKDLRIRTSVFGGCGKNGQLVRVGDGGPHIMVREIIVGGR